MTDKRNTAIFINGGAGRTISSIPALEKFKEENPDDDFVIVCEGGTDFYKGHPDLFNRTYDVWHKNLFQDKLKDRNLLTPEPYRVWEYYNQKCNLHEAYDIAINNKSIRELPKPTIKLSMQEKMTGKKLIDEVKAKTGKDKIIVFQSFGRGTINDNGIIGDPSGRSFEAENTVNLVNKLSKHFGVIFMSEIAIEFQKHGVKEPIAIPQNIELRFWLGIIEEADYFLGCDSVGQHMAYALDKPATVVVGSTFKENISYPDAKNFDVLDMGEGARVYSPIRITMDELSDRTNEGIMWMNDKIEEVIVESCLKGAGLKKDDKKKK